jgi:AcrR family transcriptional regulator
VAEKSGETIPTRGDLTRERILEAAELVFARRGLKGTRVREIAAAAGVNAATLYTYYRSKRLLYEAVLERGVQPLLELMVEFSAGPGGSEAGERLIEAVMQHLAARPHLSRLIYLETISEGTYLSRIARRWFRPLLEHALGELKVRNGLTPWEESIFPLVVTAFVHLCFGHFALAPLFREVFDQDPLSGEWVERQTRFLGMLIRQMFPEPAEPSDKASES